MHLPTRNCNTEFQSWANCRRCILWRTRRRVALRRDSGDRKHIHVLFVGEAPGELEDLRGIPFVGISGNILNHTIKLVQFPFSYTITNLVCCRPMTLVMLDKGDAYNDSVPSDTFELGVDYDIQDKNREPTKQEVEACKDHLIELIDELQPNAIVTLGKEAVQITKLMKEQKYKIPLLKLVHPAFIARKELKYLSVKKQARKLEKFLEQL